MNRYFTQAGPLGRQIRIPGFTAQNRFDVASPHSADWRQIIGVVGDARNDGVDAPVAPAIYLPYTSVMLPYAEYMVRTQGDPLTYLHAIRIAVATVGMDQQISMVASPSRKPSSATPNTAASVSSPSSSASSPPWRSSLL